MKLLDEVKFQRQDGTCQRAWLAWEAEDVKFLYVDEGSPGKVSVEVARDLDGDGIFQRAENYTLDQMEQDILRTCRELVESMKDL